MIQREIAITEPGLDRMWQHDQAGIANQALSPFPDAMEITRELHS